MHVEVGDVDKNKQQCVLGVYMLASGKLVADDVVVEPLEFVFDMVKHKFVEAWPN
jgi:hypothetical protein